MRGPHWRKWCPKGAPRFPKGPQRKPKMKPKGLPEFPGKSRKSPPSRPRTSQEPQRRPQDPQRPPKGTQKSSQNDTPKKPKFKMENRCKRHRDSDSTDATLKQHYVENDLGPAECAERLNKQLNEQPSNSGWGTMQPTKILND